MLSSVGFSNTMQLAITLISYYIPENGLNKKYIILKSLQSPGL